MEEADNTDRVVEREIVLYDEQADVFSIDPRPYMYTTTVTRLAQFYSDDVQTPGKFMWVTDSGEVRCDGDYRDRRTWFEYYVGKNEIVRFVATGGKYTNFAIAMTDGQLRPFHTPEPVGSDMGDPSTQFVRSRGSDFEGQLVRYQSRVDQSRFLAFDLQGNPQPLGPSSGNPVAREFICLEVIGEKEQLLK